MTTLQEKKDAGRFWAAFPWLLLGAMLVGWALMMSLALNDPSFGLEDDYYRKAAAFDETIEQRKLNQALGWQLQAQVSGDKGAPLTQGKAELHLRAQDAQQAALSGLQVEVEAFPVARSSERRKLSLREVAPGQYLGNFTHFRAGIWEFRINAQREQPAAPNEPSAPNDPSAQPADSAAPARQRYTERLRVETQLGAR